LEPTHLGAQESHHQQGASNDLGSKGHT
jgi:hypothetical protein